MATKLTELAKWMADQTMPMVYHLKTGSVAEDHRNVDMMIAGAFTVPADGGIDMQAVADKPKATGYSGWIVVAAAPCAYPKIGYDSIVQVCGKTGTTNKGI